MDLTPRVLESDKVRLEPLSLDHLPGLCAVGLDAHIWRWYTIAPITTSEAMRAYVDMLLAEQTRGTTIPFTTVDRASGKVVGGTRFLSIDAPNRRFEIGSSWIAAPWQRSHVNTHAKLLMLTDAFEARGCVRVEFKTDALNIHSRTAIKRIGATMEGTFRKHALCASGRWRDSVYFSITDEEWPRVKERLAAMAAGRQPEPA
jgi:N-acetyltransferase